VKRQLMHAKIHNATVTEANLAYVGSITIAGEPGSGVICMNGAAAHLIKEGDEVIIIAFAESKKPIKQKVILVDKENRFVKYLVENDEEE